MLLGSNGGSQVEEDERNSSQGEDALYRTLKIGMMGLGLYKLFKSGALRPVISPLLETADLIAKKGLNTGATSMNAVRRWSNLNHLTPEQLEAQRILNPGGKVYNAPEYSFFRLAKSMRPEGSDSFGYSVLTGLRGLINGNSADFHAIQRYIQGSQDDIKILRSMISDNIGDLAKKRGRYSDTDLYRMLIDFDKFSNTVEHESPGAQMFLKQKYLEEMLDYLSEGGAGQKDAIRMTGYRKATLGDIAELKGRSLVLKENAPFEAQDLINRFNAMAIDPGARTGGEHIFKTGVWKDMAIDSRLRINEAGTKTIDYRMAVEDWFDFLHSLANDFGLPAVKFNPFKSILGLDKVGTRETFGAWLSANQLDPSITERAVNITNDMSREQIEYARRQTTIGQWLKETVGEERFLTGNDKFDALNGISGVAVINGKAVVATVNRETGQLSNLVELKDGLKLYDISRADTRITLPRSLNAERQMAGLDIGHARDWYGNMDNYTDDLGNPIALTRAQRGKHWVAHWADMGFQEARAEMDSDYNLFESMGNMDEAISRGINWVSERDMFRMTGFEYPDVKSMFGDIASDSTGKVTGGGGGVRQYNYKTVFGQGPAPYIDEYRHKTVIPNMYYAQRRGKKPTELFKSMWNMDWETAGGEAKEFFGQFFTGRMLGNDNLMSEYFTEYSGSAWSPWGILNALTEGIGSQAHQLGLSTYSKRNPTVLLGNLLARRALPVYMLTQVPGMINWLTEPFFGEDEKTGQPDNISRWLMRGPVKKFDIAAHKVLDTTHITNLFKKAEEFVPGWDQIEGTIPGVHGLGLSQTPEEREEWIENGYDPIRKGRYWGMGNTPWTGTKILYWRPNLYRRVEADVMFSDSKWGSRQEYYENTWYPNPVNPLAPVNHFILNRNHYDIKHYMDRPYLQTAPAGANIPIVGPLFSQTVGRVISPPQKMHLEYWRNGLKPLPEDEVKVPAVTTGQIYHPSGVSLMFPYGSEQIRRLNQQVALAQERDTQGRYASQYAVAQHMKRGSVIDAAAVAVDSFSVLPKVRFDEASYNLLPIPQVPKLVGPPSLPVRTYDRYGGNPLDIYRTPSGGMSIVDVPDELNLYNVNQDLRQFSINKVQGTNKRVDIVSTFMGPDIPVGNDVKQIDNQFVTMGLKGQFNMATDVAGLKGFAIRQFVTGRASEHARVVEDSGYAYGMNKSFWDQNLGGFGSNLSEITRRFVPDRDNSMDYVNPIRNTMPQWMPGSNYFTDFKHGDPYSKIMNGEERLPGEGYERLHHIDVMNLHAGASSLGYSREDMVQKFIGQGSYRSTFNQDALDTGTKIHRMIEANWMETGFAINVEQKVEDKRNNITGQYDALVNDPTSPTGVALVDIKTTNRKKFNEIKRSGVPLEQHAKQLNYYMWATMNQNSNGYIYYVDKEHPEEGFMAPMRYSPELLQESLTNLYAARDDVRYALKKGIIGRGDLYSPLDRMRILGDVAPYSQEYADAAAAVSQMKLKPEQEKEVAAIRERVKEQKEPLRVYPYKFKTSNVQGEWVTVKAILDNNTILTREYGKEHAVKFAGIHVSESSTDLYTKHKQKYKDSRGVARYRTVGTSMKKAAEREIRRHVHPGAKVYIQYDADEKNKFSKDSTRSIRAVVRGIRGENVNKILLERGLATEKENDNSPAGVRARYTNGEIAFGSALERINHGIIGNIPFVGSKILQVQSPYEMYRRREVYGKDFQSWNNPISSILIPNIQRHLGEQGSILGVVLGGYMGSLFGKNRFGKMLGAFAGATTVMLGKQITTLKGSPDGRRWRPERRIQQERINEYVDMLKYVKNVRLYEQYKEKAKNEDHFDVDAFMGSGKSRGIENQIRRRELEKYKRTLKLDFGNRDKFAFNTGAPKYATPDMSYKESITAINKEISELQSDRKVYKASANAMKAIYYKQAAQATMYGFEPGDSLVNIMSALPKKERQYFKHFMNAPEEEKGKILEIAPSYLRRALQASWGMPVDPKPTIDEYFSKHGLPDENWIGWREDTDMNDVKVKIVHANKGDFGEFDIWDDNRRKADEAAIPVPNINATNSRAEAQNRLVRLLGQSGYHDVQMRHGTSIRGSGFSLNVKYDAREDVENEIYKNDW